MGRGAIKGPWWFKLGVYGSRMSDPQPDGVPDPETVDPETGTGPDGTPVENPSGFSGEGVGATANHADPGVPWFQSVAA